MVNAIVAIAAGMIGSVVTLLATGGLRYMAARYEIEAHDRLVDERDEDLEQWVADDHYRLTRELRDLRNDLNKRNLFYSGEYGYQLGLAKERTLHAYRGLETAARRETRHVHDQEGWLHAFRRRRLGIPQRQLAAPARVKPVLDAWKLPPSQHLSEGDTPPSVDDPRERTIERLLAEIGESTADLV